MRRDSQASASSVQTPCTGICSTRAERARRDQADPQAGVGPGADADGDRGQLRAAHLGLAEHGVDRRGEHLGVPTAVDDLRLGAQPWRPSPGAHSLSATVTAAVAVSKAKTSTIPERSAL